MIDALVQQGGIDLRGSQIDEPRRSQKIESRGCVLLVRGHAVARVWQSLKGVAEGGVRGRDRRWRGTIREQHRRLP